MKIEKINIENKLSGFSDYWNPRIVGELNGQHVKLVKFQGEFVWHQHNCEDELFYVLNGELRLEFREKTVEINENEFIIVPMGVEHRPVAEREVSVMLFEPCTTVNTGDNPGSMTKENLDRI
ncbi:MAG TPA: cupin domain-containing protein [Bacteroidales bacterium]|nr:cupin domain-containing protein [Bacteroidales bacterium]